MKLTTEQRLDKAVVSLMRDPRTAFLSGVLAMGTRAISEDKAPTACTDGLNEWYNPGFVGSLSDAELQGVVLHETLHKAYKHLHVWQALAKEDHRCANMAMDYVINKVILDMDFVLPDKALHDPKYDGMDTQQVYNELRKNPPPSGNGDGGDGEPMDTHDWENAASGRSQEEIEQMHRMIDTAIRQGEMAAKRMGSGGGDAQRLGLIPPAKLDWRTLLVEFLTATSKEWTDSTWRRPSRRSMAMGIYLPSHISESLGNVVLAIDTSGSVSDKELGAMLSEVQSLCLGLCPQRVTLLYWDGKVEREETYTPGMYEMLTQSTRAMGGGGTDPQCVKDYLEHQRIEHDVVLILTDGYVPSFPVFDKPTAWVITTPSIIASNGRTITLEV